MSVVDVATAVFVLPKKLKLKKEREKMKGKEVTRRETRERRASYQCSYNHSQTVTQTFITSRHNDTKRNSRQVFFPTPSFENRFFSAPAAQDDGEKKKHHINKRCCYP